MFLLENQSLWSRGIVSSKIIYAKEAEADAAKFRDYFDWIEPLRSISSHLHNPAMTEHYQAPI